MKLKFYFFIILIITMLLLSVCKGKERSAEGMDEGGPGDDYQALPNGFSYPYGSILDGDLSEFAGLWVNGRGDRKILAANGVFYSKNPEEQRTYNFARGADGDSYSMAYNGTDYSWANQLPPEDDGMAFGFMVVFFPVGVGIIISDEIMPSDTSRDRIITYAHDSPSPRDNSIVYYQEKSKLLHYIESEDLTSITFEYDNFYRISKTIHYRNGSLEYTRTYKYNGNNCMVETLPPDGSEEFADSYINYQRRGNTITYSYGNMSAEMIVNFNDNIVTNVLDFYRAGEVHNNNYEYNGSNTASLEETVLYDEEINRRITTSFRYDNMKSPFFSDLTPNWILQIFFPNIGLTNNIIYESNNLTDYEYQYHIDDDGYPAKRVRINHHGGETERITTYFNYLGEWKG